MCRGIALAFDQFVVESRKADLACYCHRDGYLCTGIHFNTTIEQFLRARQQFRCRERLGRLGLPVRNAFEIARTKHIAPNRLRIAKDFPRLEYGDQLNLQELPYRYLHKHVNVAVDDVKTYYVQ